MRFDCFGALLQTTLLQKVAKLRSYVWKRLGTFLNTAHVQILLLCVYHLRQVADVRPKLAEAGSGHADYVSCKPKGEGDIAQDFRARFVVYRMF